MKSFDRSKLELVLRAVRAKLSKDRKAYALNSFKAFLDSYFSHLITENETSHFRRFIHANLERLTKENQILLFESYRSSAKTTLISRLFTLYRFCKGEIDYGVIISSTLDLAKESTNFIRTELEENELLKADFEIGILKSSDEDLVFSIDGKRGRIKAYGSGKKMRGTNFLGKRPNWVVLDDIENDENILSKNQRDKLYAWFFKAALKLVAIKEKNYNFIIVGTRLHHDGLLARLSTKFKSFKFGLVREFGANFSEVTDENYKSLDYSDMVLDDDSVDKLKVVELFLSDRDSFYSEYQNEPLSREGAIFLGYQTFKDLPSKPKSLTIGIDPSLGKAKGDFFAITLLFRCESAFYAKTYAYKLKPDEMIGRIISFYTEFADLTPVIAIETVAFQEFFKDTLKKEARENGLFLRVKELKNSGVAKEIRIDALSPLISDGTVKVWESSYHLREELETYPLSANDDCLDSLEMAVRVAVTAGVANYAEIKRVISSNRAKFNALKKLI